jgi:hypothetical protein
MFKFGKNQKKRNIENIDDDEEEIDRKPHGNDSERKTWGFPCSPDIYARMKMMADRMNVPLYGITEHALQLSAGLIARMVEQPEEEQLLRQHILESHVGKRTIEKIARYDEEMADILEEERQRNFQIDSAVRQIVVGFARKGMNPSYMAYYLNYGYVCFMSFVNNQPFPKPTRGRFPRKSQSRDNQPAEEKGEEYNDSSR